MKHLARVIFLAASLAAGAVRAEPADPTRPPPGFTENAPDGAQPREPALAVSSLFLMGARPYAVVDGQIVHVGDKLAAGRVSRIDAQGVWLKVAGGQRLLRLLPEVDKRPSRSKGKVEKR